MKKLRKRDKFLILSIAIILCYIVTSIIYQILTGKQFNDTLTTGVFAFFGSEIGACCVIKVTDKEIEDDEREYQKKTDKS